MARKYWLMKTEPDVFSFDDLKDRPHQTEPWDGIRNYQARNYMRDEMKIGDRILFYHSRCDPPGVVGIAEVVGEAVPDPSAWDSKSEYFDEKASPENPRWCMIPIRFYESFPRLVSLEEMKADPKLADMRVVQRGNRLSIMPVTKEEFDYVVKMTRK